MSMTKIERTVHHLECSVTGSVGCPLGSIQSGPHGPGARIDYLNCEHGNILMVVVTRWVQA